MNDLAILRLADGLARHASGRHSLISENIANADTPGFRAKDLQPFQAAFDGEPMRATRAGHLEAPGTRRFEAVRAAAMGAASPNGNDVALDEQMVKAAQALGTHDKATAVYGKTLDILRLAVGGR
jgi:flagellar basal-body rod protein FlgB